MKFIGLLLGAVLVLCGCSSKPPNAGDGGAACSTGETLCLGSCVDTHLDNGNCGGCGTACAADEACAGGQCYPRACGTTMCADSQVCIGGACFYRNCFGVTCAPDERCAQARCLPAACGATPCADTEVCSNDTCTEVSCVGVLCPGGTRCSNGTCSLDTCNDGIRNGSETDVDCGGNCAPCGSGLTCTAAGDCASKVCTSRLCVAPTCTDGVRNGAESDIDCGTTTCGACSTGRSCTLPAQCESLSCQAGVCRDATCVDTIRNGTETDIDCGGTCSAKCGGGKACAVAADCQSGTCSANRCLGAGCSNGIKDADESDIDCGGSCGLCAPNRSCAKGADCSSGICNSSFRCTTPLCTDSVRNGTETDLNCGGGTCPACAAGLACLVGGDCLSTFCDPTTKLCRAATCTDGVRNGAETDVDCGGGTCPRCGANKQCGVPTDCVANLCVSNQCAVPPLFAAPLVTAVTPALANIAVADVDLDGHLDLVTMSVDGSAVTPYWGVGNGTFVAGNSIALQTGFLFNAKGLALGDFNNDGRVDILAATDYHNSGGQGRTPRLQYFGGAATPRTFLAGVVSSITGPGYVGGELRVTRVDADSYNDAIVSGEGGATMLVASGTTGGITGAARSTVVGSSFDYADVNADGLPDIVSHDESDATMHVFLRSGAGYVQAQAFGVPAGYGGVALGKMNATDTSVDFVAAVKSVGRVLVGLNQGTGLYAAPSSFNVTTPDAVRLLDVDGDGDLDVLVAAAGLAVLRNDGAGNLAAPEVFGAAVGDTGPLWLGDFNEDGLMDAVTATGSGFQVFLGL